MFAEYVFGLSGAEYTNRILLFDDAHFEKKTHFSEMFAGHGFEVVHYDNDLSFRIKYEDKLKQKDFKIAVIAEKAQYIPFDIKSKMRPFDISFERLFPKLNPEALHDKLIDYDLLCLAYHENYKNLSAKPDTERFLKEVVYGRDNVGKHLHQLYESLLSEAMTCSDYRRWFVLAEEKATIDVTSVEYDIPMNTTEINLLFKDWVLKKFGSLSSEINNESPVLVSKTMEFIHGKSKKFVIIVMDGMSEYDWNILSRSFLGIPYEKTSAFAMIPTITSVSRQCLLSNKYPTQLLSPWSQSKEKSEFFSCARDMGFSDLQIAYVRGYNADFSSLVRCAAVIIMDIDDLVHGQKQGRLGMSNDVGVMAKQKKLADLVQRLRSQGYDVYISADHGNTPCTGLGKHIGSGVETETKSHRMIVLKDFADKDSLKAKYGMIEYPKYYLPKEFDYLFCNVGESLDTKGEDVMNHGGITLDEVVVPFIKIKAVQNNG